LFLGLLVFFAAGAVTGRTLFAPAAPTAPGTVSANGGLPEGSKAELPSHAIPTVEKQAKLKNALTSSQELRAKLKEYLSQPDFAADTSTSVIDEKRTVKLTSDLDKTPQGVESIFLNNIEVQKLLELLEALEGWPPTTQLLP
jgi:hypothetical protein